jgi:hypothetical protein
MFSPTIPYFFNVEKCKFYDSFTITPPECTPVHFAVGHFATAKNDPNISTIPYHYKILCIVEDTTEECDSKDRVVAIGQFYRYAHDKNIIGKNKYSKHEVHSPSPSFLPGAIFLLSC